MKKKDKKKLIIFILSIGFIILLFLFFYYKDKLLLAPAPIKSCPFCKNYPQCLGNEVVKEECNPQSGECTLVILEDCSARGSCYFCSDGACINKWSPPGEECGPLCCSWAQDCSIEDDKQTRNKEYSCISACGPEGVPCPYPSGDVLCCAAGQTCGADTNGNPICV